MLFSSTPPPTPTPSSILFWKPQWVHQQHMEMMKFLEAAAHINPMWLSEHDHGMWVTEWAHVFVCVCVCLCVCVMIIRPQWRLLWCVFLLRHGDMLFLFPSAASSSSGEVMDTALPHTSSSLPFFSSSSTSSTAIPRSSSAPQIQEDEIDQYLTKQDGKIYRNRDPQL